MTQELTRDVLRHVFSEIDRRAADQGVKIEMSVYGGAVMVMEYEARKMTRDVDAVVHSGSAHLRAIIGHIADENGWEADWLNDGVKGFLSENASLQRLFAGEQEAGGLVVMRPVPEYLFAMKAMAMRSDLDGSQDVRDIEFLAREMDIRSHEEALDIVSSFYPDKRISPKTVFGLEEIISRVLEERPKGPGES